jgi:hypothetical protein
MVQTHWLLTLVLLALILFSPFLYDGAVALALIP